MKKNDGGAAYPNGAVINFHDGPITSASIETCGGMTLRDWFAGQALTLVSAMPINSDAVEIAEACYLVADAMLAERGKE